MGQTKDRNVANKAIGDYFYTVVECGNEGGELLNRIRFELH